MLDEGAEVLWSWREAGVERPWPLSIPLLCGGLEESQSIQVLASPGHGGLGVLGSHLSEVQVRDVTVGTTGVLCVLRFTKVSIHLTLPPSCPFLSPLLTPSKAPEVGGYFRQGRWSVPHGWLMNGCPS